MFSDGDVLVERYAIIKHLRRGNVHDFWLAKDKVLDRVVLIRLRPSSVKVVFGDVFLDEARMLANLEHPHILPVYDFGEHDGTAFTVVRYIEGGSLEDYLDKHSLSVQEILRLGERLASAIDFLHQQKIVHSDIKPRNILLGRQLHPYLTNLFVSSVRKARTSDGTAGFVGSPMYEAPESLESQKLSPAMDIYSFGITLYQCLTPTLPTQHRQPFGIAQLFGQVEKLPSVRDKKPELPLSVDAVLQRLTRKAPEERFPNASDAMDALNKAFYSGQQHISGKVFLSYARADKDYVYSLAKELRQVGLSLWIDQDIPSGVNWDKSVELALSECDMLLLIASPNSMLSNNVQDEWSYYLDEGKPVYTFVYQECDLSFRLRRRQYITGTGDLLNDVAKIVEMLSGGLPNRS